MNGTRGILILVAGLSLLVAGVTPPPPCQAQIFYGPTPEELDFIYSPLPDPDYYGYSQPMAPPQGYYVIAPAPMPCQHGYKHGWKEYSHGKQKPKKKHKNKHKYRWDDD